MKKSHGRWMFAVLLASALMSGCAKQTYVEITTEAQTQPPETTAQEIEIETTTTAAQPEEELPPYYLPEERVEKDGKIMSYLTGQMTDVSKANRRPIAIMMSNDKQALPQYGINRAGVVYELSLIHI